MRAKLEPIPVVRKQAKIIPFPVKKPAKMPNMKCMKTDMIGWRF